MCLGLHQCNCHKQTYYLQCLLLLLPILCSNLTKSLGEAGEIEGESEAILLENNVDFADFSKEIIDSLPELPWSIPKVGSLTGDVSS